MVQNTFEKGAPMPRGDSRHMGIMQRSLGMTFPPVGMNASEDPSPAIRRAVQEFAQAWYWGDADGMLRTLHPDYVNRLVTLGTQSRPLGVQGSLGSQTPPDRRTVEVRILEVRKASASAVAELCGWVIHLHLARSAGPWKIVNAMWESRTA
jgi:hypothetical protein